VESRFGRLPASDAEVNGDLLQTLVRLATMTGDRRFSTGRGASATPTCEEVLPGNHGVPSDASGTSTKHTGDGKLKLRDHGNEIVVGLACCSRSSATGNCERCCSTGPCWPACSTGSWNRPTRTACSTTSSTPSHAEAGHTSACRQLGLRLRRRLHLLPGTGEEKYRDAVRRVLSQPAQVPQPCLGAFGQCARLPLGSFDGYADSLESALYLVNREPVPEALEWIDTEMKVMLAMQQPDGLVDIENWYGEGNFNRTALLYADMKSQGVRPRHWKPGTRAGAVRDGERLYLHLDAAQPVEVLFDYARHRRVLNFDRNYVRLNEFPEWFIVDENTLYRLYSPRHKIDRVRLGSELIAGVLLEPGGWTVEPVTFSSSSVSVPRRSRSSPPARRATPP
jgi:hypothetical protein